MIGKADLQFGLYILHSAFENFIINVVDVVNNTTLRVLTCITMLITSGILG